MKLLAWSLNRGQALHPHKAQLTLLTDASTQSWGGHLNSQIVSGTWSQEGKNLHINLLELKAIILTLQHFVELIKYQYVRVMSDNTTVVSYIKNQGGTQSVSLFQLTQELFLWCDKHKVSIRVSHIPGKLNTVADMLSLKGQILLTEWILNPEIFKQIVSNSKNPSRFICKLPKPSTSDICKSIPRQSRMGSGCSIIPMGNSDSVRLSADQSNITDTPKNTRVRLYNHSNSSMLAKPTMVPNTVRTTCRLPVLAAQIQKDVEATTV